MWGEIIGSGDAWIITALATKLAQIVSAQISMVSILYPYSCLRHTDRPPCVIYVLIYFQVLNYFAS